MKTSLLLQPFAILLFACAPVKKADKNTKDFDKKLVGSWEGTSSYRFTTKNWEITRKADGTFTAVNSMKVKNINRRSITSGTWWTNSGKYFQQTIGDEGVMSFTYAIESAGQIKFRSTSVDTPEEFTEIKK